MMKYIELQFSLKTQYMLNQSNTKDVELFSVEKSQGKEWGEKEKEKENMRLARKGLRKLESKKS